MALHRLYSEVHSIRRRAGWIVLRARRLEDGGACVLLAPGRTADLGDVNARFDEIERAHASISHPRVPKVTARHSLGDRPVLELACDAVADGIEVIRRLARTRTRIPYPAADAFIVSLRQTMQAAHAARPNAELCLGRMSAANTLFAENGAWYLVGFGANFPVEGPDGIPDGDLPYFQAPELGMGGAASPIGDYIALMLFMRSVLCHLDQGGPLGRVLHAALGAREPVLTEAIRWIEQRLISELPAKRASISDAVAMATRIRALLGVSLDPIGFQRLAARLLATAPDATDPVEPEAITLGPEAEWIALGDLAPRPLRGAARRITLALFEHHLLGASSPLRSVELLDIGWPDERPEYESGLNRVYVTMNRLKRTLPEGVLERFDDGYRLSPEAVVRRRAQ